MRTLFKDVRGGASGLRRNAALQPVALLALASVMALNIATVRMAYSAFMRCNYDPSKLVLPQLPAHRFISCVKLPDWKSRNHVFGDTAALVDVFPMHLTGPGEPEQLTAAGVTVDFFRMIHVKPAIGRTFLPQDDAPTGGRVVVLSHQLWERRFESDRSIIGKTIKLDGQELRVIGVLPADFTWNSRQTDVWVPYRLALNRDDRSISGPYLRSAVPACLETSRRNQCV